MRVERVVVDTNVLISALLSPAGTPRRVLDRLAGINATLLFSDATFAELATRLAKPKFDAYRSKEQMNAFLDWLATASEWVNPNLEVSACRDPSDNKFLSLAICGEADYLITGDRDLLSLDSFEGVPIGRPSGFMGVVSN